MRTRSVGRQFATDGQTDRQTDWQHQMSTVCLHVVLLSMTSFNTTRNTQRRHVALRRRAGSQCRCRRKPERAVCRTTSIGPQFSGDPLLVVTLLNNDRLLVANVHEVHLYGTFT